MADKETRELRKQVHAAFDPLWRRCHVNRNDAYKALADALLIDVHDCHVGMFNALRCKAALDCIKRIRTALLHPSVEATGAAYVPAESEAQQTAPF